MSYIDDSLAKLIHFEGSVRWMYSDSGGLVTTGVGEMLPNPAAACQLPFQNSAGLAGADEIVADYQRVKAMQPGLPAASYYADSSLTLLVEDIQSILRKHLVYFDSALTQFYPGYLDFPEPIKLALLDLIFNLGVSKLEKTYPTFNAAVKRQDWTTAAAQCHRNGPAQERNDWARQQFLNAVVMEAA